MDSPSDGGGYAGDGGSQPPVLPVVGAEPPRIPGAGFHHAADQLDGGSYGDSEEEPEHER